MYGLKITNSQYFFEETDNELNYKLLFLFTFLSRVPKEDPSGRSIILEEGEFQRIKVCFMMKANEIHIKKSNF